MVDQFDAPFHCLKTGRNDLVWVIRITEITPPLRPYSCGIQVTNDLRRASLRHLKNGTAVAIWHQAKVED